MNHSHIWHRLNHMEKGGACLCEWRYPERHEAMGGGCGEGGGGWWYSMWQTPGTHASSTFHAAHSPDAGLPQCPCPPPATALCARIISQQRRRRRWSHPSEGSHPLLPPSILYLSLFSLTLSLLLSLHPGCLHPLPLQSLAWRYKETPPWQR